MKIICDLKGYGQPKKHSATTLIAHLRQIILLQTLEMKSLMDSTKTLESISIT